MPDRPLILLDVDGVLNILGDDQEPTWDVVMSGHAIADGSSWPITWAPEVIDRLNGWIEAGVEVQWLTTWGHDANASLRHLVGLPELAVAGTHDDTPTPQQTPARSHAEIAPAAPDPLTGAWWKYDVVKRLLEERPGRRLIWVDDELFRSTRFRHWADAHELVHPVGPDGDLGLTGQDLSEIDRLLALDE